MTGDTLEIQQRELAGAVVVSPRGALDVSAYGTLRDALLKAGVAEPRAVIVDLGRLTLPNVTTVGLFTWVAEQLDQWPGVPLVVVAPVLAQRVLLARVGVSRFVPVRATVDEAVTTLAEPPMRQVACRDLPNAFRASVLARRFIWSVCAQWRLRCGEEATIIANELVENTLVHTYCAPSLRLELRHGMLAVAVYDDDPERPSPEDFAAAGEPLRGLRIVRSLASACGSAPTVGGGKVVWAVLRP
jgi:anti-anti-sigma regulatory factor